MVGLHRAIKVIRPLVFKREEVERHRLATVDDALGCEGGFRLGLIEDECLGTYLEDFLHGCWRGKEWMRGKQGLFPTRNKSRRPKVAGTYLRVVDHNRMWSSA